MASLNPTRQLTTLVIVLLVILTARADNTSNVHLSAFAGTWQEDLSKTVSTPPNRIRKYEQNPDGTMSVTIGTEVYHDTFRIDGKPHPEELRPDVMQTWTQTGPSTWESTDTKAGRVLSNVKRTVSPDGSILTFVVTLKTNGQKDSTETTVYSRISAEKSGLAGTWKPVSIHSDTPDVFTLGVTLDGALSYTGREESYRVKADGNRYPIEGDPEGVSLQFSGDRTLKFSFFMKGKPFATDTLTLSSDGQSFTATERDATSNTPTATRLYRKQP